MSRKSLNPLFEIGSCAIGYVMIVQCMFGFVSMIVFTLHCTECGALSCWMLSQICMN